MSWRLGDGADAADAGCEGRDIHPRGPKTGEPQDGTPLRLPSAQAQDLLTPRNTNACS